MPANHRNGDASWLQFEVPARWIGSRHDLTGFFDAWAHGTTALADKYLYPGTLGPLKPNRP
ncbi:hypothetical protein ACWGR4_10350 [Embleya sp. NPDC055664]